MNFSPEGNRNHAACVAILERMSREELAPGKYTADEVSEASDHGRFVRESRTETSTLYQSIQAQQPAFERDDEAASKLREWTE